MGKLYRDIASETCEEMEEERRRLGIKPGKISDISDTDN